MTKEGQGGKIAGKARCIPRYLIYAFAEMPKCPRPVSQGSSLDGFTKERFEKKFIEMGLTMSRWTLRPDELKRVR